MVYYPGTPSSDTIVGSNRADLIVGMGGDDFLYGGRGDDIIYGSSKPVVDIPVWRGLLPDPYYRPGDYMNGGDGNDTLYGSSFHDTLAGGAGNDVLYGDMGDDRLDGRSGRDRMLGGGGNDIYRIDNLRDTITESRNEGIDTVITSVGKVYAGAKGDGLTWKLGGNFENLTINGKLKSAYATTPTTRSLATTATTFSMAAAAMMRWTEAPARMF